MKTNIVTGGVAIPIKISQRHAGLVKNHQWSQMPASRYFIRRTGDTHELLHRRICNAKPGERVYFVNGDRHDLREENLRAMRTKVSARDLRTRAGHGKRGSK